MKAVQVQSDRKSYRVLVFRRHRTELLLLQREAGFQLPSVEIPRWERVAENLTVGVKGKWGCEAICLFELSELHGIDDCVALHFQTMESCRARESYSEGALWVSIPALSPNSFCDVKDYAALKQFFAGCNSREGDPSSPFVKPGWFEELKAWISKVIQRWDLQLAGSFRQFNADRSFSLIRFETNGPAVWFKAVGAPNRHEFAITLKLAELFPSFVPHIIGTRPDWNGWLSLEVLGTNLSDAREIGPWERAAATLARLQIESLGAADQIMVSGGRHLGTAALAVLVHPFFDSMLELMNGQTKIPPHVLTDQELSRLAEQMQRYFDRLLELSIMDALGHLDPNPGNIIVSPEYCTFLDWAEAYVGNPFFTFHYLLEHFRRAFPDSAAGSRLIRAYAEAWRSVLSPAIIHEGLQLSGPLAVFAYAVRTNARKDQETREDPGFAGYLRSLTRRMNRETNDLNGQRSLCLC